MSDQQTTAPATPAPATSTPAEAMVPSGRLRQETERAQAAEAQLAELRAKLGELEASKVTWQSERAVYQAGITDPEGVAVATFLHGQLPAEGRPAIDKWLGKMRGEGGQIPRALAAYFPQPAAPAPAASAAPAPAAAPQPKVTTTAPMPAQVTTSAGTQSAGYDEAQIRALRIEAQRTGNYEALRKAMPDIMAAVKPR